MKISSTSWWKNRGRMQCIGCRKWMDADDPDLVTIKVRVGEGLIGDMTAPSKWDFCSECWYEFQRVFLLTVREQKRVLCFHHEDDYGRKSITEESLHNFSCRCDKRLARNRGHTQKLILFYRGGPIWSWSHRSM
jgi:hypothetical protein